MGNELKFIREDIGSLFENKLRTALEDSFSDQIERGNVIHPSDLHRLLARRFALTKAEIKFIAPSIGLLRKNRGYQPQICGETHG